MVGEIAAAGGSTVFRRTDAVKGGNTSFQCTGYTPHFPFPDFPNGVLVTIQGTEVTDKNGYLFKGIESDNFLLR